MSFEKCVEKKITHVCITVLSKHLQTSVKVCTPLLQLMQKGQDYNYHFEEEISENSSREKQ